MGDHHQAPSTIRDEAETLAEALVEGTNDSLILAALDGETRAVRGGDPLATALGLTIEQVLHDPEAYIAADDVRVLRDRWAAVCGAVGAIYNASFSIRGARGQLLQIDAAASNLTHTPIGAVVVRLRTPLQSEVPPPAPSDSQWPADPLIQKPQFLELVQKAVQKKLDRVWNAPKHARSVSKDRRCDFAVVLLNIDRWGVLRGSFGDLELDGLMRAAAERLRHALRSRDAVAHLGGAELGMYLDGVADAEHAERVTDAYTRILEDRFEMDGESISLAPIIGIATSERRYERATEVLQDAAAAASRALRHARSGRQAYQTGFRIEDRRRLILASDLREALKRGDVYEQYQPIVRLVDRELVGFEALCRWNHPTLGMVGPHEFIPVAEEVGLIRKLGNRVLVNACGQAASWNAASETPVSIAVNVSAAEIVHFAFAGSVETALAESGLEPQRLTLEVTESALLEDMDSAKTNMAALRERGVQFALDDFGTGYASLAYLVELPFQKLKIDRSLIHDEDPHRRKVVRAVVALGHELGLRVVGEGVETHSHESALKDMCCDDGQGYLYGAAVDVSDAEILLRDGL